MFAVKDNQSSAGKALIELMVVFPLIWSLTAGGWELSRWIKQSQAASVIGREAADIAFRKCADFREPADFIGNSVTNTTNRTLRCIEREVMGDLIDGVPPVLNAMFGPGATATVVVSVYRYDDLDGLGAQLWRIGPTSDGITTDPTASRFSISGNTIAGPASTISAAQIQDQQRMVIAEVSINFDTTTWVPDIFAPEQYNATIF